MENINIIEDIDLVINLLKNGYILVTSNAVTKTFFALKNSKVFASNISSSYYLSLENFKNLFYDAKFIVYEHDEASFIDHKKDEEYYSYDILKY